MTPALLNLAPYYRGDAWEGLTIGPISDGGPPDSPCVSARIHFRDPKTRALGYALSTVPGSGEGTIIIDDAVNYEFTIPQQVLGLAAGKWLYDFETIDAAGKPLTWIKGSITVTQDQTYG